MKVNNKKARSRRLKICILLQAETNSLVMHLRMYREEDEGSCSPKAKEMLRFNFIHVI